MSADILQHERPSGTGKTLEQEYDSANARGIDELHSIEIEQNIAAIDGEFFQARPQVTHAVCIHIFRNLEYVSHFDPSPLLLLPSNQQEACHGASAEFEQFYSKLFHSANLDLQDAKLWPRCALNAVNFLGTMIAKGFEFTTGAELSTSIVHIVQRLAPGGLEVLAVELARGIGSGSKIISLEGDGPALTEDWHRLKDPSIDVVGLRKGAGFRPGMVCKVFAAIVAARPHAIVTHHIGPLIYGGLAARMARVPLLVHVEHDAWHLRSERHRRIMRALVGALRPRLVAVSDLGATEFCRHLPDARIRAIPNGIDLKRFKPQHRELRRLELGLPAGIPIVGSVGRLEHVKGHDVLIDALPHIKQDCRVVIVGDGSLRDRLKARASALGVGDRILFLGHRDDVASLYPCFDLFVLPSRNEGLSISLLEAQACGVPIVASDVGATGEAVCPDTSRLVRPDEPRELARNISEALGENRLVSPREFVIRRFDFAKTLASYRDILELRPC